MVALSEEVRRHFGVMEPTGHTSAPREQCEIGAGATGSGLRGHRVEGHE